MSGVLYVSKNPKDGRDFVVSDIHGAFDVLEQGLRKIKFDKHKDRLFAVGDLINRGPQSHKVRKYLKKDWFFAVRGNHEEIFIGQVNKYGDWTEGRPKKSDKQYGWKSKISAAQRAKIVKALESLPYAIEVETEIGPVGIVHADAMGHDWTHFTGLLDKGSQPAKLCALYGTDKFRSDCQRPVRGISRIFSGHSYVKEKIQRRGNHYFIESGIYLQFMNDKPRPNKALAIVELTVPDSKIEKPIPADRPLHLILK